MTNLFQSGPDYFKLHSGVVSCFKIECDALTPDDWKTLAEMIAHRCPLFRSCSGVERGGDPFALALQKWAIPNENYPHLVVDDVWTTGASIKACMNPGDIGWVVFARNPIP